MLTMKKIIISLLLLLPLTLAAQTMKQLFTNMPDTLLSILNKNNRLDLIDFVEAGMTGKVKNIFEGESRLDTLTANFLSLTTTATGQVQMKLLPTGDTTRVVCMVQTVCAEACDSYVRFFTTDWKELPASRFLSLPSQDDFFVTPADSALADTLALLRKTVDMTLMRVSLSSASSDLKVTFTTPDYLGKELKTHLTPFLRPQIIFRWEKDHYVR